MANSKTDTYDKLRVVIVDDSRTMQAMLDNAFSARTDFRVVGFSSNAAAAVDMIRGLMPDVVTIDLNMPYIDGATLLGMISDLQTVCKIVVSDAPLKNLALAASLMRAGAALCLGKTDLATDPDDFFAKVRAAASQIDKSGTYRWNPGEEPDTRTTTGRMLPVRPEAQFPVPADEKSRLQFLSQSTLINNDRERRFDLVTRHLTRVTDYPVSLLTFIDRDTQWIKSASGLEVGSTPREEAFCNYTIAQGGAFVVANAASDRRFAHFTSVASSPDVRCYAGYPVTTSDGVNVGALCVIDNRVRTVSRHVLDQLAGMADIVAEMIDQRTPAGNR
ncbi:CheY-like chemotaxis protein [Sphingomonas jinjuensis]|uniref:CheY-like chemotaxis protein n=1 Tax=Sphingomonas jinjuensis TaxID=535907 RepID=A0A840FNN2_9SPHN|nr:response regulator [Sphingomonas jinjuensis]MBB4155508.1 CheY-like chemotaxis protein [Sphingomonas jinjuensis]